MTEKSSSSLWTTVLKAVYLIVVVRAKFTFFYGTGREIEAELTSSFCWTGTRLPLNNEVSDVSGGITDDTGS